MTTAMAAIADQSSMPVWGWKGWALALVVALTLAVVSMVREDTRKNTRRRDGRG